MERYRCNWAVGKLAQFFSGLPSSCKKIGQSMGAVIDTSVMFKMKTEETYLASDYRCRNGRDAYKVKEEISKEDI